MENKLTTEEKLSVEKLLKPRWEVINSYPSSQFKVGDIEDRDWCQYANGEDEAEGIDWKISDFPHLFKKLEWWEAREEKDMPAYLMCICSDFITFVKGQIISVEKHQSNTFNQYVPSLFISKEKQSHEAMTNCVNYKNFLPATEQEYLNQQRNPA